MEKQYFKGGETEQTEAPGIEDLADEMLPCFS
jgi:hypothetical protein